MMKDFAKFAEAIGTAARKGVQVEILWQQKLEEDLRLKQLEEQKTLTKAS